VTQVTTFTTTNIRCVQWHDDYVIYDQLSGDTHVLDEVSGGLICALSKQALSRTELLVTLTALFVEATEPELESYLDEFVEKFELLGLLVSE